MKGVSEIIANILMLIITVGLVGTAYVYISGMMATKTEKTISMLDADCNGTHILLVVNNEGIESIAINELIVYINNQRIIPDPLSNPLGPRSIAVITSLETGVIPGQSNTILVISPSNSVRQSIWC